MHETENRGKQVGYGMVWYNLRSRAVTKSQLTDVGLSEGSSTQISSLFGMQLRFLNYQIISGKCFVSLGSSFNIQILLVFTAQLSTVDGAGWVFKSGPLICAFDMDFKSQGSMPGREGERGLSNHPARSPLNSLSFRFRRETGRWAWMERIGVVFRGLWGLSLFLWSVVNRSQKLLAFGADPPKS